MCEESDGNVGFALDPFESINVTEFYRVKFVGLSSTRKQFYNQGNVPG